MGRQQESFGVWGNSWGRTRKEGTIASQHWGCQGPSQRDVIGTRDSGYGCAMCGWAQQLRNLNHKKVGLLYWYSWVSLAPAYVKDKWKVLRSDQDNCDGPRQTGEESWITSAGPRTWRKRVKSRLQIWRRFIALSGRALQSPMRQDLGMSVRVFPDSNKSVTVPQLGSRTE